MELLTALLFTLVSLALPPVHDPVSASSGVTVALEPAGYDEHVPLPPILGPQGAIHPLVVLDPGHGGHDPGAISPRGRREKEVTLRVAEAIRDALLSSGRVRVALTRDDDTFLPLRERYEIARRLHADLFISIHADAAPSPTASGATIYTLSEVASDQAAASLASRENKVDLAGAGEAGDEHADVNRILFDLAQRESMDVSAKFASLLYREASPSVPFRPVYHSFAAFVVLKAPDVPSILFECGYLTHEQDLAYIDSDAGRRQIADGMRRAIEANFAKRIAESRAVPLRRT